MKINKILSFDGYDYDVIITDGQQELICSCFPKHCEPKIGMKIQHLAATLTEDLMRIDEEEYLIEKIYGEGEHYSYNLQGKVLDTSKSLIGIHELTIELDAPLPKDIKEGEFIEFKVDRLDCFI